MSNDAELLRRYAVEGDDDAFTELVRRHIDFVHAAALRQTHDPHRAKDVTQLVFSDLARKAGALSRRTELVGWLFTSARYASLKVLRTEARRVRREQEAHMAEQLNGAAESGTNWAELRPVLDKALSELNTRDRDAILLRFFQDRSLAEVGAALQLTEEAARKRIERALDRLHARLAQRGITSTAAALGAALTHQAVVAAPAGLAASVASTALTQAATAGGIGALIGALQFMSMTKTITGIAAITGMLAIGTAIYEARQTRELERARNAASQTYATATQRLETLRQRLDNAERAASPLNTTEVRPAQPARPASASALSTQTQAALERGRQFLAAHPEATAWIHAYQKASFDRQYGPFCRSIQLTPEQTARLETLIQGHQTLSFNQPDGKLLTFTFGAGPTATSNQELRALLGDENYARFTDYSRGIGSRTLLTELAGNTYYLEKPLTPEQTERFAQILLRNNSDYQAGRSFLQKSQDWDQTFAEAQTVLTGSQLVMLSELRTRQETARRRAQAATTSSSAAAGTNRPN
ncbi:MAG: sigma-70 family RNA polymerase sigma factor [Opitutae bacterium]|nr:sigma-70 family RNA polymerase sigma factor [Opitutae bacterium]